MTDFMALSSSFSGDSGSHEYLYDVFLSFRGGDTRKNFVDHVYAALEKEGFLIFRDGDELERGEDIKSELMRAIRKSRCSIVVFSEGYASSRWCLDELVMILECKRKFDQFVFPVFYGVDPSHVRDQKGSVAEAFDRHVKSQPLDKVKRWKSALTEAANISGMVMLNQADWNASKFIEDLVATTKERVQRSRPFRMSRYLVGIDSRVKDINSWLQDEYSDIGLLVVHGTSGIGKTTIAKCAYNLNMARFYRSSFLENISETSQLPSGLLHVQERVLYDICGRKVKLKNVSEGKFEIGRAVYSQRFFLVLDGLESMDEFDAVTCGLKEARFGSKIIITTTNARVLSAALEFGYKVCTVGILNDNESLELFCWHAFKQFQPIEGYMERSKSIVQYCGGLPLALAILGSSLSGRSIDAWESTLKELKTIPDSSIMRTLKISYDSLYDHERALFLHIACFFVGIDRDYIVRILHGCDFDIIAAMESLIEKCLLTIDRDNKVYMHRLILDVGKEIARQEARKLGKRSRMWREKDSFQVLTEKNINFPPETSATGDLMTLTSSSSSNSRSQYLYDVFLSFRGEDTRENFVDHLYAALKKEGLLTFRDDNELERGEDVEPRLLRTIRKSRCSIVVFSEGYASSRWCLDELVMILECKRTFDQFVLPVFYGVDPSDVRKQTESIAKAFARHEKGQPLDKVKVWRAALTEAANIGGTMLQIEADWHERKFIKNLVAATTEILQSLLIRLCPVELNGFFEELPKGLKWSRWFEFPLNSIPDGLTLDRLVVLEARYSSWRQVWKGRKYLPSLKILDVCHSHNLTEVPDLSLVPNLEKLILNNCKNLVGIHGSIGKLERLVYLNIKGCKRIRKFPKHMPENLETIITHGCSNLEEFRIMQSKMMMHLKALDADEAHISGLVYGAHKSGRTFWDWFNKNTKLIVHVNIPHLLRGCEKFMKLIIQQYHAAANNQKLKWLNHKDSGVQNLKLIPSVTVSLHKLSKVADSYSAGTTYIDLISCQGSKIVEDVNLEEKAGCEIEVADVEDEGLTESLKSSLFLYCSLFPLDYEFRKYELVQLWIAEGFIGEMHRERMEDTGILYFDFMESEGFFVPSRSDFSVDFDSVFSLPIYNPSNFLYKINTIKLSVLEIFFYQDGYFRAVDGKLDGASEMTQHLSLIFKNMDEVGCGVLQKFKHLRTLLLFNGSRSSIKQVPRNLLSGLKLLRTLNLSGTLISELPSSIRNVKALRYLDVSHTPIRQLPEAIDSLHNLQTIKLRGCVNFVQLPKGIKKLTNLRHVELDIIRQLDSLPAYLGNLTNLQTLSAFLVGRDPGCNIGELKNLNHLKGALRISRLENVLTKEEAEKASLSTKKSLQRVVLRWSSLLVENVREKEILECLQPHYGLQELGIQNYSGSTLPAWISNRAFADLLVVTLYRCKNCKRLPSLGQLPALKFLSIIEMNEVEEIHHHLFRNDGVAQEDPAFPKLERLEIDIMLNLKEWMAIKQGDLPSLLKLTVDSCPELVTLPSLSELKSLKHLEFRHCPKLLPLSQDGLPTSLESLVIICCPQLKEWCTKRGGLDQDNLSHVPRVWLDHEELKMQGEQSFSDA